MLAKYIYCLFFLLKSNNILNALLAVYLSDVHISIQSLLICFMSA